MMLREYAGKNRTPITGWLPAKCLTSSSSIFDGLIGEASLCALERVHGPLPLTVEVRTAKGRHIYLRLDGRAAALPRVILAAGSMYAAMGHTWWSRAACTRTVTDTTT